MSLLTWLVGLFGTPAGAAVGRGVTNAATLALAAGLGSWFLEHRDEIAFTITWGQFALTCLIVLAILKVAHYTPPPPPRWWPRQDESQ